MFLMFLIQKSRIRDLRPVILELKTLKTLIPQEACVFNVFNGFKNIKNIKNINPQKGLCF